MDTPKNQHDGSLALLDEGWTGSGLHLKHLDEDHSSAHLTETAALFEEHIAEQFRTHWLDVQSLFVDDPQKAVKYADELVTHVIENIISTFSEKRLDLESQWNVGDQVSTEELRLVLKRYRSLMNRLLALAY